MLQRPLRLFGTASLALTLARNPAGAQNPETPEPACHARACALIFDWGPTRTAGSWGPDRRYGSGEDFEVRFRGAMGEHGFSVRDAPGGGPMGITLRPTMRVRVLCDIIAASRPDRTCTAMSDLAVNFTSSDPDLHPPGALRISNRCGSSDTFMTMTVFATYAADMIYFSLEGQAKKQPRPTSRC